MATHFLTWLAHYVFHILLKNAGISGKPVPYATIGRVNTAEGFGHYSLFDSYRSTDA